MNNETWTPTPPWKAVCDKPTARVRMALVITHAGTSAIDCTRSGNDYEEDCANARRIVACVNAAEGISTEALEAAKDIARAGIETVRNLELQRDALAEALRKAEDLRPLLLKQLGYVPEGVLAFCNEARLALAKLK